MSLWRRIRNLWWLSGQDFLYQNIPKEHSPIGLFVRKRPASIVDTSNPLDNVDIS